MNTAWKTVVGVIAAVVLLVGVIIPIVNTTMVSSRISDAVSFLEGHGYWVLGAGSCVPGDLDPCTDNTYDLGDATHRWRQLHLVGPSLYLGTKHITDTNILGIAVPAQGQIVYYDGTDWVALNPGAVGQYLQTQGAGANPQWAAGGGGVVNWTDLGDTPANYVGQEYQGTRVNALANAIEFIKYTRSSTLVVAASNANALILTQADYVCDAVADDIQIQAACTAAAVTGGSVQLSEGDFNITTNTDITVNDAGLVGMGASLEDVAFTQINMSGTSNFLIQEHGYLWDMIVDCDNTHTGPAVQVQPTNGNGFQKDTIIKNVYAHTDNSTVGTGFYIVCDSTVGNQYIMFSSFDGMVADNWEYGVHVYVNEPANTAYFNANNLGHIICADCVYHVVFETAGVGTPEIACNTGDVIVGASVGGNLDGLVFDGVCIENIFSYTCSDSTLLGNDNLRLSASTGANMIYGAIADTITNAGINNEIVNTIRSNRQFVIVNPNGGGHYTSVVTALAGILDNAANKRYEIYIRGHITESASLVPKSFVDLIGWGDATVSRDGSQVIYMSAATQDIEIRDITFECTQSAAADSRVMWIDGAACTDVRFINCRFLNNATGGNPGHGMIISGASGQPEFWECDIQADNANSSYGIHIDGTSDPEFRDSRIDANTGNWSYGVNHDGTGGGRFFNCDIYGHNDLAVYLADATNTSYRYRNCHIEQTGGGKVIDANANEPNAYFFDCELVGTVDATMQGFFQSNSGVATILNGNANVVVTHYLGGTPNYVLVTGTHAEATQLYVTAVGAANFTINTAAGATTANRDVYWMAWIAQDGP